MAASRINIIAKSFSSSPVAQKMIRPPVQIFGVEGRYATALYSAAHKQKSLDIVEKDLIKFQGLMKSDQKLAEFVKDPSIKRKLKAEAFKSISKIFSPATINLLSLMAENGRLGKINQVINAFKLIMAAERGEVVCEVITAKPLDADLKGKLETALKSSVKSGQSIQLTAKVDPTIIGGMIVSIGDKYADMSVASKIKKYTDVLNQAI